jgi:hypothetical protein
MGRDSRNARFHVFCGPTISRQDVELTAPTAVVHPPARHGDLYSLNAVAGDVVLIIDGLSHQSAPLRHKEILDHLARGVHVAGSSSMGALRAAELAPHGMQGIGRVYRLLADGTVDKDDEVAVAHLTDDDYRALSEPLVNFRLALSDAVDFGVIKHADVSSLLKVAREIPFASRTWKSVQQLLVTTAQHALADSCAVATAWLAQNPQAANAKRTDALAALKQITRQQQPQTTPTWTAEPWATQFVLTWRNQFETIGTPDSKSITKLAAIQFCQLYDPTFPALWHRLVLACIAGQKNPEIDYANLIGSADSAIRQRGIAFKDLSPQQRNRWLTPNEQNRLDEDAQLRTLVVRSTNLAAAQLDFECPPATNLLTHAVRRSDEALAALETTSYLTPVRRTLAQLSLRHLENHLDMEWAINSTSPLNRMTAALDRGFHSFRDAAEASRPFFLARISK